MEIHWVVFCVNLQKKSTDNPKKPHSNGHRKKNNFLAEGKIPKVDMFFLNLAFIDFCCQAKTRISHCPGIPNPFLSPIPSSTCGLKLNVPRWTYSDLQFVSQQKIFIFTLNESSYCFCSTACVLWLNTVCIWAEWAHSKDIMALYSAYVLTHNCPIMFLIVGLVRDWSLAKAYTLVFGDLKSFW